MPEAERREYRNAGSVLADNCIIYGYAATFDRYEMMEIDGVKYYEQISPQAFAKCSLSDVVFLRDHEGRVLARTTARSLEVFSNHHGLAFRADLSKTRAARAMLEDIKAGNYTQASFSFTVARDHYDNKAHCRIIDEIKRVYDVSAVAFPQNPYTEIGIDARAYFIQQERAEAAKRERDRKALQTKLKIAQVKAGK